jgi:hypothetical protein
MGRRRIIGKTVDPIVVEALDASSQVACGPFLVTRPRPGPLVPYPSFGMGSLELVVNAISTDTVVGRDNWEAML